MWRPVVLYAGSRRAAPRRLSYRRVAKPIAFGYRDESSVSHGIVYREARARRRGHATRSAMLVMSTVAVLALTACATRQIERAAQPRPDPPSAPSQTPSLADYNTLRSARTQLYQALAERDWRRQRFAAYLGLTVLTTMHPLQPGRCADFIASTYDELLSLHDNYRGENWAPLVTIVRRDPPMTVCRTPGHPRIWRTA